MQSSEKDVNDAIGKAEVMAKDFIVWAKANNYSGEVKRVWWTARPGSMASAVGRPVDQKKNPTDILVQFTSGPNDGFLGLSAKATKTKGDIGFKNPGIGTIDKSLSLKLAAYAKQIINQTIIDLKLPKAAKTRKAFIRDNPEIKDQTEKLGSKLLSNLRDQLFVRLQEMEKTAQPDLLKYLLSSWMDAEISYPPYIKITGQGSKAPYSAVVSDPLNNPKLKALSTSEIILSKVGNDSIGVKAGTYKIMKIRFKFESEKMASSIKLSGDPW